MYQNIANNDTFISKSTKLNNTFAQNIKIAYMQSTLIVKNFGPIKAVKLELKNVNVFIGPQASGKSALAKIYTIFKAPRKFFKSFEGTTSEEIEKNKKVFLNVLEEYNIRAFLKEDTEIIFNSELHDIEYKNGQIVYDAKLYKRVKSISTLAQSFDYNKDGIIDSLKSLEKNFIIYRIKARNFLRSKHKSSDNDYLRDPLIEFLTEENCGEVIEIIKKIEENLSTNTALYIPAERNFINIIKNSSLNLILNNVPIPKHILSFGAELEKTNVDEISLDFLDNNLYYKNIEGEDRIFTDELHSIKLSEAASGIQSVLPILLPILDRADGLNHRSFVIEEPELNLFPSAQYNLIQFLESRRSEANYEDYGTIHTYTTHSPYILSTLNNLLYANKVRSKLKLKYNDEFKSKHDDDLIRDFELESFVLDKIQTVVKTDINPYYFNGYQIVNGTAESIFDINKGLIKENYIDESSDIIDDDFEALMELAK